MLHHFPVLVYIHQRKFQIVPLQRKELLHGPVLSNTSYCVNYFCHLSKVSKNLYLFNKMLIYASGKEQRNIFLQVISFSFWVWFLPEKKNGINLWNRQQVLNREEGKGPYLSCSCNHCWVMYCDCNFSFNWQASGMLWELVSRWWISVSILAGWSNKPRADIDICHSTLEPHRCLCWLIKYFTLL